MDVQRKGYYPEYKRKEFEREHIVIKTEDKNPETIQGGTVDFIGFSYYMSMVSSTDPDIERTEGNRFKRHGIIHGIYNIFIGFQFH
jgi:6-phospho-beta-glucosidase